MDQDYSSKFEHEPVVAPVRDEVEEELDYVAVPTVAKFHKDNSFFRGVRGPIGSGKSVGGCVEVFKRACAQKAYRGKRLSRWAIIRNCYDDQTEILTENRGFRLFRDLIHTDCVAVLIDGAVKYQLPERVHAAPYNGEMVGFESEGADFLVTPDHKMYVSKKRTREQVWGEYEERTAEEIFGSTKYRIKRSADWAGARHEISNALFEWLGYWFAEGSHGVYGGRDRCVITTKNDIEYARDLFERAGIGCWENNRSDGGINFTIHQTCKVFQSIKNLLNGKSHSKYVPGEIKAAASGQLQSFIYGFFVGDGHQRKDAVTKTLYTSSKQLADDLQEMALKAGLVANISSRDRTDFTTNHIEYIVTLVSEKKHRPVLQMNKNYTNHLRGWYKQEYDGMVYCVEMPLVPVYVRRNGKAFWCYRTYPELKTTTVKTWQDWFDDYGDIKFDSPINFNMSFPHPNNDGTRVEAEVWFIALDTPADVKKLKSLELTGAFINEAVEVRKSIVDMLTGRVGRYPRKNLGGPSWVGIWADTNSPDDLHWWYDWAEEEKPEGYKFWAQPPAVLLESDGQYRINPEAENLINQPLGQQYWMQQVPGKDQQWINVFLMGNYGTIVDGKPVYAGQWGDLIHVSQVELWPIKDREILIGMDFGLDPTAIIGQISPRGQLRILDEVIGEDMGVEQFMEGMLLPMLKTKYKTNPYRAVGDPSGIKRSDNDAKSVFQLLHNMRFVITGAKTNNIKERMESVRYFLGQLRDGRPVFQLNPTCKILRKGFNGGYKMRKLQVSGEDRYMEKPDKDRFSHPHDGLQYLCLELRGDAQAKSQVKAYIGRESVGVGDRRAGY